MATKRITPKDPKAEANTAETDKTTERKTAVSFRGRKLGRKTGVIKGH